jgi:hypothetical protein
VWMCEGSQVECGEDRDAKRPRYRRGLFDAM